MLDVRKAWGFTLAIACASGCFIAADAASFWNEELGAPLLTELGGQPPTWDRMRGWAVTWAATPDFSCSDWTDGSVASRGDVAVTEAGHWIYGASDDYACSAENSILCISQ